MRERDRKQGLGVRSPRPAPVASHHLVKAVGVPPSHRHMIIPGQVPTREAREALALVMQEPTPYRPENALKQDGAYITPRAVIDNLGLDYARENAWAKFLSETLPQRNEVVVRKALFERMQGERMDQQLRQAIFQRAMSFRKELAKSMSRADIHEFYVARGDGMTVEEAREYIDDHWRKLLARRPDLQEKHPQLVLRLQKAEAKGGKYHKRIPKKDGGYHYIYDEGEYQRHPEAHLSGEDVSRGHIRKHVSNAIYAGGDAGCDVNSLSDLVKKHGSKLVASVLEEDVHTHGKLAYKGGRLYANTGQK